MNGRTTWPRRHHRQGVIMLGTLKQAGKHISRSLSRTLENISEGWRELVHHSSDALTHFTRRGDEDKEKQSSVSTFPAFRNWSLLPGDVEETDKGNCGAVGNTGNAERRLRNYHRWQRSFNVRGEK